MRKYFSVRSLPHFDAVTTETRRFYKKYSWSSYSGSPHNLYVNVFPFKIIGYSGFYVYSDDDRAYEFFTGTELGRISEDNSFGTAYRITSDIYGSFILHSDSSYYFAKEVDKYMPYKQKISLVMAQYLEARKASYPIYLQKIKQADEEKKLEERTKLAMISNIEDFLNNR